MPPAPAATTPAPTSQALAGQLANYDANKVTSTDAMNQALSQYGVPEIRNTVSGLRTTLANTQNAYNNVDPSVTGRTQGSLVTEAQREKQVSNEEAPIAKNITDESKSLSDNQTALQDALGQATTQATNRVNDYNSGRAALQQQYTDAQAREQAAADLAEKQREFDLSAKNSANSGLDLSSLFGGGSATAAVPAGQATAQMVQRGDKGFNFTDQNGNAINAAQYAHLTGQNFRDVLQKAANAGDTGSKAALNFVGNDYGYDPTKINSPQLASLYQALTGQAANVYKAPTGNKVTNLLSGTGNSSVQKQLAAAKAAGKVK